MRAKYEANEHFRQGVYTDVNDLRKAEFNEVVHDAAVFKF